MTTQSAETSPESTPDARTVIRTSPVTMRITQSLRVEHELDVVAYFRDLPLGQQREYAGVDYGQEYGYEQPWERPMAFLASRAAIEAMTTLGSSPSVIEWMDEDTGYDNRVTRRWGTIVENLRDGRWTKADYETLVNLVPWMTHYADTDEADDLDEDDLDELAVRPGPNDVPIPGLEA